MDPFRLQGGRAGLVRRKRQKLETEKKKRRKEGKKEKVLND